MADNYKDWHDPESQSNESSSFREAWDRLPDESDRAWQAFVQYRDSENRSLTEIAKSSNFECSVSNISRWCVVHHWRDRTFSFDSDRDEKERAELARGRMAMRRRHLQIALAMQSIGAAGLQELQEKIRMKLPLHLTAEESRGLLDAGAKLERQTLGEGRDSKYTKIVVNVGEYQDEEEYEDSIRGK